MNIINHNNKQQYMNNHINNDNDDITENYNANNINYSPPKLDFLNKNH